MVLNELEQSFVKAVFDQLGLDEYEVKIVRRRRLLLTGADDEGGGAGGGRQCPGGVKRW